MIEKSITICGQPVPFRASAAIPRLYRMKFKRDIFKDMKQLSDSVNAENAEASELSIDNLELFENVAYIMAYHADKNVPEDINDWLDQFEMFSIYEILPELLTMWGDNLITTSESKKNLAAVVGK